MVQLMKRLSTPGAVNGCMDAVVHSDLVVSIRSGARRADLLLPLYVPGERAQERRVWLADVLIALLQCAQVRLLLWAPSSCRQNCWLSAWGVATAAFVLLQPLCCL
jgi:hypothetical protein